MLERFLKTDVLDDALQIARRLADHGHLVLFAGGCVRDALLGRPTHDIDIATSAKPGEVEEIFRGETIPVGKSFGIIVVKAPHGTFEVATFRADGNYTDGRHPDDIRFADAEADAARRDFTVNGLFFDPIRDKLIDYVGGQDDLGRRVIRAIGDAGTRFKEDKLRMLRAVRFASTLGFEIERRTFDAIRSQAGALGCVSAERIGTEFTRMLTESAKPSDMLAMLLETGLLEQFLPEIVRLKGCRQPPKFHPEGDVWNHTCMMLDRIPAPRPAMLAYAVLLHDIGKPATTIFSRNPDGSERIRSPGHADVGADMVPAIMERLKMPKAVSEDVATAVRHHMMFPELPKMRIARRRHFLGASTFQIELELFKLDLACSSNDEQFIAQIQAMADEFKSEPALPPPVIRGADLIEAGFKPGPLFSKMLQAAYDLQLESPTATKAELLGRALKFAPTPAG